MEITRYIERGFHLFPVGKDSKTPLLKNNLELASCDVSDFKRWRVKFKNCNWGLSLAKSGLVAVDVDAAGLDAWYALLEKHGEPSTLKALSGSGKGLHYIFKAKEGAAYKGKLAKGIDIKHNGYVLVEPSIHPRTGKKYVWVDFDAEPEDMPKWLFSSCEKVISTDPIKEISPEAFTDDYLLYKNASEYIKNKDLGYDEWLKVGMGLHAASGGSQEGLNLFLDITEGVNYKEGDLETAASKWKTFTGGGGVGPGSFFQIAKDLGYNQGAARAQLDFEELELDEAPAQGTKNLWRKDDKGRKVTSDPKEIINVLNKSGYALLKGTHEGQIVKHWVTSNGVKQFKMMTSEHFKNSVKHMGLFIKKKQPIEDASEIWLKAMHKQTYDHVVFRPEAPPTDLNLWCGIPCKQETGDVSLILELVKVLCGGNAAKEEYFLKWLAHLFQFPEIKPVIVPVFIGEQGAGKGLFFDGVIAPILTNDFYSRLDKPGVIKERFNAEQARKFMTVLDEASWRGDHELNGILKSLTGSPTMTIEEKFGGRYSIENYSRYVILSNDIEAVRIETSNRRFLVFKTSNKWKGTGNFKLVAQLLREQGAHKWFYNYLMKYDCSDFDPYSFPEHLDTETNASKVASMSAAGRFWYEVLFFTPKDLFSVGKKGYTLPMRHAYETYLMESQRSRPQYRYSLIDFIEETKAVAPILNKRESYGGVYHLTPREFAESFCETNRLGPVLTDFDDLAYLAM